MRDDTVFLARALGLHRPHLGNCSFRSSRCPVSVYEGPAGHDETRRSRSTRCARPPRPTAWVNPTRHSVCLSGCNGDMLMLMLRNSSLIELTIFGTIAGCAAPPGSGDIDTGEPALVPAQPSGPRTAEQEPPPRREDEIHPAMPAATRALDQLPQAPAPMCESSPRCALRRSRRHLDLELQSSGAEHRERAHSAKRLVVQRLGLHLCQRAGLGRPAVRALVRYQPPRLRQLALGRGGRSRLGPVVRCRRRLPLVG